ncbi:MAG: hypothetical protein AB4058_05930 [Microcystaceae cyanobacterium]
MNYVNVPPAELSSFLDSFSSNCPVSLQLKRIAHRQIGILVPNRGTFSINTEDLETFSVQHQFPSNQSQFSKVINTAQGNFDGNLFIRYALSCLSLETGFGVINLEPQPQHSKVFHALIGYSYRFCI